MRLFASSWTLPAASAPAAARADDIGPAQAQALQQQLKDWLAGLLGPSVKLPDLPWRITGEHDHYVDRLADPRARPARPAKRQRPRMCGRWTAAAGRSMQVTMPPSGSFTMTLPETGEPARGAGGHAIHHRPPGHPRRHRSGPRHRFDTAHRIRRPMVSHEQREAAPGAARRPIRGGHQPEAAQDGRLDLAMDGTDRWLEVRLADRQRHAGGDRHREASARPAVSMASTASALRGCSLRPAD